MEIIFISHSAPIFCNSGIRAIVPFSFMISIKAPAGYSPAKRQRSMAASVWPLRRKTPLSWAYKGLMCPGRPNVCGVDCGSANALMVSALSCADTPVVHPSNLSMVIVNGVPSMDVLSDT